VPALRLTSLILQSKSEDGATLLDGIFSFGIGGCERGIDSIESLRGGEGI
jgi:hypothetical protein